ncbi:MAG: YitT family protein [Butyribacter sp.]|nr:YitT family protein [bacterium]MDY3854108.1 YitT family protein [Butyribacter sp.]
MQEAMEKGVKIVAGTFLMATAVNFVFEPMNMVIGGVAGFSILIKDITSAYYQGGIPVWLTNVLLNIPIFCWGYFVKGRKFLTYTLFANICYSFFLFALPVMSISQKDYFLAALYGGVLTGAGLGLVFAAGYSTGGTDLLSSILHEYIRNCSVASILFCIDAVIILLGALVFGIPSAAYAIFAVFLSSKIMDSILSGRKTEKQVWIISEAYQKIGEEIMEHVKRGVTSVPGKGMYSNDDKNILLCVVEKRQIVSVVGIVRQNDKAAFVIVQDATEVMGEGFQKME